MDLDYIFRPLGLIFGTPMLTEIFEFLLKSFGNWTKVFFYEGEKFRNLSKSSHPESWERKNTQCSLMFLLLRQIETENIYIKYEHVHRSHIIHIHLFPSNERESLQTILMKKISKLGNERLYAMNLIWYFKKQQQWSLNFKMSLRDSSSQIIIIYVSIKIVKYLLPLVSAAVLFMVFDSNI